MDLFFVIFVVVVTIVIEIINIFKNKKDKSIKFDEFDDIDEVRKQEEKEKEEMEYEYNVLRKVYSDTYNKTLREMGQDQTLEDIEYNRYKEDEIPFFEKIIAEGAANDAMEKARKDLADFRLLDSVDYDKEDVTEGNQISSLRENGNNFETDLFKKWSLEIFKCIKSKDEEVLETVKNFMTEELYSKLLYQRKQFEKDGLEFITEDLRIQKCVLYDYSRSMSKEELKVRIDVTMKEYIIRKSDNTVVRGDKEKSYNKNIIMTFVKRNVEDYEGLLHNCPNCGAEVSQTEFGRCKYCNTLIFPIRYNWTLTNYEAM